MKTLCIACPFCHPEFRLQKELKPDYILSAPGSTLLFEISELDSLKALINRESITEIVIMEEAKHCSYKEFQASRFNQYFVNSKGELKGIKNNKGISIFEFFKNHPLKITILPFEKPIKTKN